MPIEDKSSAIESACRETHRWIDQIQNAARLAFPGQNPKSQIIQHLCQEKHEEIDRLSQRRRSPAVPIVLLGPIASGKGWLSRIFLLDPKLRQGIPSGDNAEDRSTHLLWIGPHRPELLESEERHYPVASEQMLDLGVPYMLGDAPGLASSHENIERIGQRALLASPVKILIVPQEVLRDRFYLELLERLPSAWVLPVIRFRGQRGQAEPSESLKNDFAKNFQRWKQVAPQTKFLDPLFLPDADLYDPDNPDKIIPKVQAALQERLAPLLANSETLQQATANEILGRKDLLRRALSPHIQDLRRRTFPILQEIEQALSKLLPQLAREALGNENQLRALIRIRLRARWLESTPVWCFPYRTILGLLILTSNAWDRLILSLLGSWPSMLATAWQSVKNARAHFKTQSRGRKDFSRQLSQQARESIAAPLRRLARLLNDLEIERDHESSEALTQSSVEFIGIKEFQDRCLRIPDEVLSRSETKWNSPPVIFAVASTAVFAALFTGPVWVLYRDYVSVVMHALFRNDIHLSDFPQPSIRVLMTSFFLSAFPLLLLGMIALTWATRRSLVQKLVQETRDEIESLIGQWSDQSLLQWKVHEPHLQAVRLLTELDSDEH